MNICQRHWEDLRKKVDERGMSHLVSSNGEEAMARTLAQLNNEDTSDDWDPLMAAFFAIGQWALNRMGLAVLQPGFCPLCQVQRSFENVKLLPEFDPEQHKDAEWWMNNCMDAMLDHARECGLVPIIQ